MSSISASFAASSPDSSLRSLYSSEDSTWQQRQQVLNARRSRQQQQRKQQRSQRTRGGGGRGGDGSGDDDDNDDDDADTNFGSDGSSISSRKVRSQHRMSIPATDVIAMEGQRHRGHAVDDTERELTRAGQSERHRAHNSEERRRYVLGILDDVRRRSALEALNVQRASRRRAGTSVSQDLAFALSHSDRRGAAAAAHDDAIIQEATQEAGRRVSDRGAHAGIAHPEIVGLEDTLPSDVAVAVTKEQRRDWGNVGDYVENESFEKRIDYVYRVMKSIQNRNLQEVRASLGSRGPNVNGSTDPGGFEIAAEAEARRRTAQEVHNAIAINNIRSRM